MGHAESLACELGEASFVVVSEMARGIDAAAHRSAIPTGTIGVIASGVDIIYPKENRELFAQIVKDGVTASQNAPE